MAQKAKTKSLETHNGMDDTKFCTHENGFVTLLFQNYRYFKHIFFIRV